MRDWPKFRHCQKLWNFMPSLFRFRQNAIWPNETLHKRREQTLKLFMIYVGVDEGSSWRDKRFITTKQFHQSWFANQVKTSNKRGKSAIKSHLNSIIHWNLPPTSSNRTRIVHRNNSSTQRYHSLALGLQWSHNLGKRPGQESVASESRQAQWPMPIHSINFNKLSIETKGQGVIFRSQNNSSRADDLD